MKRDRFKKILLVFLLIMFLVLGIFDTYIAVLTGVDNFILSSALWWLGTGMLLGIIIMYF